MEQEEIIKKISGIENDLTKIKRIIDTIKELDMSAAASAYESFTAKAAMKAEKITCDLRHLIYATTNISVTELMKKAADVHGIDIKYHDGIFNVTLPALLLKKVSKLSNEFMIQPLYFALDKYFEKNVLEKYGECVVAFEHIYNESTPSRQFCDYDNLELKAVLDTVASFVMIDDSSKYCDISYCGVR